ncbi:MAG: serine/threonine-protein phosphatase [Bdellovibrionaceae bacterium]|nr:serine/threonine-protein phosphatase [Pseudobdellovibrionaceae bacterium]
MFTIQAWGKTDIGSVRKENQDAILIDKKLNLYAVADGMGGYKGGALASKIATEELYSFLDGNKTSLKESNISHYIQKAYSQANTSIYSTAQKKEGFTGMGTTMVSCLAFDNTFYIANVGDSRAYLFRDNLLWQITKDHSLAEESLRMGQSIDNINANIITRSVGYASEVIVDVIERPLQNGDYILLCSDGLNKMISDEELAELLKTRNNKTIAKDLVQLSNKRRSIDNVSVLWIEIKLNKS